MRRSKVVGSAVAAAAALVLVVAGAVSCSRDPGPRPALQAFLDGWAAGDLGGVAMQSPDGEVLTPEGVLAEIDGLAGDLDPRRVKAQAAAEPRVEGGRASATVNIEWTIIDGLVWPYQTTVALIEVDGSWRVVFAPSTVHPRLTAGAHLASRSLPAARGSILDGAGEPIVSERAVVTVGIEPRRIADEASLLADLDAALRTVGVAIDVESLRQRLASANPDAFVEVVTLRREAYDAIRSQIHDLPGTVFREGTLPLAPSRRFARALLGTVGEVTREQLDANPGRYFLGEQVGQSGLQVLYDAVLRGLPGVQITVAGADEPLFQEDPRPGTVLPTTLDQRVQEAADAALAGQPRRSALVAVRVSDGAILAVANGPDGGDLNLALTAQVPPGSTFKMVSALGLLESGEVTAESRVDCPGSFTVDGRSFTNSGGLALGSVPFQTAFAQSCNTTFAALAPALGRDGLSRAAYSVGIGTTWNLGVDVFTGSVGVNQSTVEAAAAAFGQGTTLVSPVSLAAAAARVARGAWRAPRLFPELPPGAPAAIPGPAGDPPAEDAELPAAARQALADLMRAVVTSGTGSALADVPGPPVYAKTGTAEFNGNTADTHAWTIGWQGDIAFAVFVENGGGGSATAVPIAESFLRGLPG